MRKYTTHSYIRAHLMKKARWCILSVIVYLITRDTFIEYSLLRTRRGRDMIGIRESIILQYILFFITSLIIRINKYISRQICVCNRFVNIQMHTRTMQVPRRHIQLFIFSALLRTTLKSFLCLFPSYSPTHSFMRVLHV